MVSLSNVSSDLESAAREQPTAPLEHQGVTAADGSTGETPCITWKNWLNLALYVANTIVTYTSLAGVFGATNTELSKKYQTLLTPSGWAFSIWGPIFIWEGIFVIAQFLASYRQSKVVLRVSPWWWSLCIMQIAWTLAFAQEQITLSLIFMFSILGSLLGISWSTDGMSMAVSEYFLLRAPFSLQLGWIIAASVVNTNVQAVAANASQQVLLALAVLSIAVVLAIVTLFTFGVRSSDPIVGLVAAWAFLGVFSELSNPKNLNNMDRFNASIWDDVILDGLKSCAICVSLLALILAIIATTLRIWRANREGKSADN